MGKKTPGRTWTFLCSQWVERVLISEMKGIMQSLLVRSPFEAHFCLKVKIWKHVNYERNLQEDNGLTAM